MLLVIDVAYPLVLLLFTLALSTMSSKIKIGSCSCFWSRDIVVVVVVVVDGGGTIESTSVLLL